jgi:hypothetical protein
MQWFALFAPELPLLAALGGEGINTALGCSPVVVSDGPETRPTLRACNDAAAREGVMPGMGVGQARALCHALTVLPRQCAVEEDLLRAIATLALQFTPMVCIEPDRERHCVVLEVSASVKLFGGLRALAQSLVQQLAAPMQRACCRIVRARACEWRKKYCLLAPTKYCERVGACAAYCSAVVGAAGERAAYARATFTQRNHRFAARRVCKAFRR